MTTQQRHKARIVRRAIDNIEQKLETHEMKPTLTDLVRLLQIEKGLGEDEPCEVRVRWAESDTDELLSN
jgi:hypothetical protein